METSLHPLERVIAAQVRAGAAPERIPVGEERLSHLGYREEHHFEPVSRKPLYFSMALNAVAILGLFGYLLIDAVK